MNLLSLICATLCNVLLVQAQDNYLGFMEVGFATAQPLVKSPDFMPVFSGLRLSGSRVVAGPVKVIVSGSFLSDGTSRFFAGDFKNDIDQTVLFKVDTGFATADTALSSGNYRRLTSLTLINIGARYYFSELNAINPFLGASLAFMSARPNNRNFAASAFQEVDGRLQRTTAAGALLEGGFDWMVSRGFSLIASAQWLHSGKSYFRVSRIYQTNDLLTGNYRLTDLTIEEEPFSFFCVNLSACFKIGLKKKK